MRSWWQMHTSEKSKAIEKCKEMKFIHEHLGHERICQALDIFAMLTWRWKSHTKDGEERKKKITNTKISTRYSAEQFSVLTRLIRGSITLKKETNWNHIKCNAPYWRLFMHSSNLVCFLFGCWFFFYFFLEIFGLVWLSLRSVSFSYLKIFNIIYFNSCAESAAHQSAHQLFMLIIIVDNYLSDTLQRS